MKLLKKTECFVFSIIFVLQCLSFWIKIVFIYFSFDTEILKLCSYLEVLFVEVLEDFYEEK